MEQENKFVGKSKTIIGAILVFLSMLAPAIGVDFTAGEADSLTSQLTSLIDQGIGAVGLVMIVWGRFSAKTKLTVLPGNPTDTFKSPWYIAVLASILALAGCVGGATYTDLSPAEKVRASYDAALPMITIYLALPSCGPDVVGLCSQPKVADKLSEANLLVAGYLDQIEAAGYLDDAAKAKATKEAQNALRTLLTIYAVQALTKA